MKYLLNSSIYQKVSRYVRMLTWERGLVVLFTLLIACEIGLFVCSKYLYNKLNERTPIYINCNEKNRIEQMKELKNYIASSTEAVVKLKSAKKTTSKKMRKNS